VDVNLMPQKSSNSSTRLTDLVVEFDHSNCEISVIVRASGDKVLSEGMAQTRRKLGATLGADGVVDTDKAELPLVF
jgi:hypothetical protein